MSRSDSSAARRGRIATYAVASTGSLVAGSAAMAGIQVVSISTQNANFGFIIDLGAAGDGGGFAFYHNGTGLGTFQVSATATAVNDNLQGVASNSFAASQNHLFTNAGTVWSGGVRTRNKFPIDTTRYVGFRLTLSSGDNRFGWVEYVKSGSSFTVSRWAYESDVNTGIIAGATGTPAVPGLGGLAALACGAAGVRRSRHRVA